MATQADVRRIALALPGAKESKTDFAFDVPVKKDKRKGFAWCWKERNDPKKPRVPNYGVLAVRTHSVAERDAMIDAEPDKFFTEPHYAGFPAVLIRLKAIRVAQLREILADGVRAVTA